MNDIFISYNWGSKNVVHKIVDLLQSNDGYKIWLDVNKMNAGDVLLAEIKKGIDNCKVFVAFITKKYCESDNCQLEIHHAREIKKQWIIVMLDQDYGQDPSGIRLMVNRTLRLNGYEYTNVEDIYKELSKALGNKLRGQTSYHPVQNVTKVDIPELVELCKNSDQNYVRIKQLIEKDNANVNYKGEYGYTALIYASWEGHLDTVKYLVQNGATINEKSKYGSTALIWASIEGHLDTVKYLVQNGAIINEKGKDGDTALSAASANGHLDTVKYLVKNGAIINEKNYDGETALIAAKFNGHTAVVDYLKSIGAK